MAEHDDNVTITLLRGAIIILNYRTIFRSSQVSTTDTYCLIDVNLYYYNSIIYVINTKLQYKPFHIEMQTHFFEKDFTSPQHSVALGQLQYHISLN